MQSKPDYNAKHPELHQKACPSFAALLNLLDIWVLELWPDLTAMHQVRGFMAREAGRVMLVGLRQVAGKGCAHAEPEMSSPMGSPARFCCWAASTSS